MHHFSPAERDRITAAIHRAEERTSGQFVVVVARHTDHDILAALLWALVLGLFLPDLLWILAPHWSAIHWMEAQLAVFALTLLLLLLLPGIRRHLAPEHVRHGRARRLAHAQFYEQGVHTTGNRSGVLFFVALADRYVEIVADSGIHEAVGERHWEEMVAQFLEPVRRGQIAEGMIAAIEACGAAMASHYPPQPGATIQLSDGLIEL
ncbi:MAG TPA: TPM domain-containing protein [Acidiferrobacteraceae bacterium]|nr:TPM domain-containing protein [Acidiferrobacteraceae bacterium]